jgi:hypothetical protein
VERENDPDVSFPFVYKVSNIVTSLKLKESARRPLPRKEPAKSDPSAGAGKRENAPPEKKSAKGYPPAGEGKRENAPPRKKMRKATRRQVRELVAAFEKRTVVLP